MNPPREIPPDAGDEFWDCEALKLLMFHSETFNMYVRHYTEPGYRGVDGLCKLGFLESEEVLPGHREIVDNSRMKATIARYGRQMINAIVRVSQCK